MDTTGLISSNPSPKGFRGEEEASRYLQKHGYKIIERNWHKRYAELDIIALDGDCLVFVEVKSRFGEEFDKPEEAMTPWKIKALTRAAYIYKSQHPELPEFMRMDFIGLTYKNGVLVDVNLIKNITG